jgi:acyl-coenzyme A synthetase/AMP-(fatty) acid ligase
MPQWRLVSGYILLRRLAGITSAIPHDKNNVPLHSTYNLYVNVFAKAGGYPERVAFRTIGKSLTYRQLQERVLQAAIAFRENGIDARSCVALDAKTALPSLTAALAFALIGCKWVFASREAQANPLLFITHLVQDGPRNLTNRYKTVTMDESWHDGRTADSKLTHESFIRRVEPERILVIGQSSGTTGEPKFFPITADNASKRVDPKYLLDPSPVPILASMFHVLHAAIFFGLLRALKKGGTLVFGINKAHWQEAGVTALIASTMHASQIFEGRAGQASGKIPRLWVTGSPIYPAFLDQALEHFDDVVNSYGSIEASIVCHQVIKDRMAEGEVVGVGAAMFDHVLEVVDEIGRPVKRGDVGEVRYQSPLLTTGYIGDAAATKTFFRDGWFYPGDTGYLDSKGRLFITGRSNDLLNIGGTKMNAAAVDGVLQSAPGIADGACFTEPGPAGFAQLSVAVVARQADDQNKMAGDLVKHLAKHFAPDLMPCLIYFAETIPRNNNGKVQRTIARQKAESGEWPCVRIKED